jgi:hypothetical protein
LVCKALASLDDLYILVCYTIYHFNPQGSREPRRICWKMVVASCDFNPQGSREPRQYTGQNSRAWVRFQSTRLSRASTTRSCQYSAAFTISIHQALASLDDVYGQSSAPGVDFNPQGSREPRLGGCSTLKPDKGISIHKALASLDFPLNVDNIRIKNFNPQGSREPRPPICSQDTPACRNFNPQGSREPRRLFNRLIFDSNVHFNPQGSREPRPFQTPSPVMDNPFQSTRLSRASTWNEFAGAIEIVISIHKALASLDTKAVWKAVFNIISIHKALASLDSSTNSRLPPSANFNPQGSREPRHICCFANSPLLGISIHKALASLDSKIIQTYSTSPLTFYTLCSSLPSSTNSVHSPSPLSRPFPLFFRCESPWHFMLAWHSHLV